MYRYTMFEADREGNVNFIAASTRSHSLGPLDA